MNLLACICFASTLQKVSAVPCLSICGDRYKIDTAICSLKGLCKDLGWSIGGPRPADQWQTWGLIFGPCVCHLSAAIGRDFGCSWAVFGSPYGVNGLQFHSEYKASCGICLNCIGFVIQTLQLLKEIYNCHHPKEQMNKYRTSSTNTQNIFQNDSLEASWRLLDVQSAPETPVPPCPGPRPAMPGSFWAPCGCPFCYFWASCCCSFS